MGQSIRIEYTEKRDDFRREVRPRQNITHFTFARPRFIILPKTCRKMGGKMNQDGWYICCGTQTSCTSCTKSTHYNPSEQLPENFCFAGFEPAPMSGFVDRFPVADRGREKKKKIVQKFSTKQSGSRLAGLAEDLPFTNVLIYPYIWRISQVLHSLN